MKNILITYVTRTGNTEAVARMIQDEVGGDLFHVETAAPYPKGYRAQVNQVVDENASDFLPPLKGGIEDIGKYDTVFLGAPTWGMQLPPPMKSFLSQYDLTGKTVIPFNTNGGYGTGSSFQDIAERMNGKLQQGFSTKGGEEIYHIMFVMKGSKEAETRQQVNVWLKRIGQL
ncbi:MAG: flavodoxin [Oenococcus sp.]|uniref:flavodoxin n=1 Tax=Oenococcus sp. TaxID=1979414 RepID=UPI0039ED6E00